MSISSSDKNKNLISPINSNEYDNDDIKEENSNIDAIELRNYSLFYKMIYYFFPCCLKDNITSNRIVKLNIHNQKNFSLVSNVVKNEKYNVITLIPLVLLNQFSMFSNQFYLLMCLSQFINVLKVGFLFSYLAPLIFVLLITIIKEFSDDFKRYLRDKETNNQLVKRFRLICHNTTNIKKYRNNNKEFCNLKKDINSYCSCGNNIVVLDEIKSSDLQIGDIIYVEENQRLPADVVLLHSNNNQVFIRTDQLDGETDWKLRKPSKIIDQYFGSVENFIKNCNVKYDIDSCTSDDLIAPKKCCINLISSAPNKNIYDYKGYLEYYYSSENTIIKEINNSENKNSKLIKEPLFLENTMWANTVLASSNAIGLVVFIGKETKSQLNNNKSRSKIGKLDIEINTISKLLFLIMFLCSFILMVFKEKFHSNFSSNIITFFRFMVLLCSIIPISLRVNLDLSKTLNSINIGSDKTIEGAIARNSTIPEDLGRVDYLFCDKTGTLTKNEMVFKSIALETDIYTYENSTDIKKIIREEFTKIDCSFHDLLTYIKMDNKGGSINSYANSNLNLEKKGSESVKNRDLNLNSNSIYYGKKKFRRNKQKILRDSITAMSLCNSVNVVEEETEIIKLNVESIENLEMENLSIKKTTKNDNSINEKSVELEVLDNNDKIDDKNFVNYKENSLKASQEKLFNTDNSNHDIKSERTLNNHNKDSPNSSHLNYQASSPDEVALVKTAAEFGCKLSFRDEKTIKIRNSYIKKKVVEKEHELNSSFFSQHTDTISENENFDLINQENYYEEEYEILNCFPFSSETKRMGIILRNKKYNYIVFYIKGAESVIKDLIKEESVSYMKENCENLAFQGLRTLVYGFKLISQDDYLAWEIKYNQALNSLDDRPRKIASVMTLIEMNFEFLCVTGVEDLLQENVLETVDSLRQAGIKIWMLTGDKVETATCIGISTGIKHKSQGISFIVNSNDNMYVKSCLENLKMNNNNSKSNNLLVIDGPCLDIAMSYYEELFFELSLFANSVICCRCSPTQKATVLKLAKKYTNKRLACIGDGGNDVAMIQEAHVGIGLVGKEGMQASLASDFSIIKYKDLNHLLLWHGRRSYKNTATISKFIIHRGMIISFIQVRHFYLDYFFIYFLFFSYSNF